MAKQRKDKADEVEAELIASTPFKPEIFTSPHLQRQRRVNASNVFDELYDSHHFYMLNREVSGQSQFHAYTVQICKIHWIIVNRIFYVHVAVLLLLLLQNGVIICFLLYYADGEEIAPPVRQ